MQYGFKKFRLWVVVAVAAITVTVFGTQAFAAQEGEQNIWFPEQAAGAQIHVTAGFSEARNPNGNILQVWHDRDSNYIRVSYNHGGAALWPGAVTQAAPRVIWTGYGWRVFHTGQDGSIYYAGLEIRADGTLNLGTWQRLVTPTRLSTYDPPAVVGLENGPGSDSESWYIAYRDANGDVRGQYHQRLNGQDTWSAWQWIGAAQGTVAAPGIAFNASWNRLVLSYTRPGSYEVGVTTQILGSSNWSAGTVLSGFSGTQHSIPTVALTDNSNGQIAIQAFGNVFRIAHIWLDSSRNFHWTWGQESTGWQTFWDPWLTAVGNFVYLLASATDNQDPLYWKQSGSY
ncbi:hypothetical protein [Actinacidiphila sp. bgisy160]|uniref:hypothetical protein n=1 Tax=Actinacidiphila sp. bgisy160 TaxID=3413796 RepID=UPI003D74E06B